MENGLSSSIVDYLDYNSRESKQGVILVIACAIVAVGSLVYSYLTLNVEAIKASWFFLLLFAGLSYYVSKIWRRHLRLTLTPFELIAQSRDSIVRNNLEDLQTIGIMSAGGEYDDGTFVITFKDQTYYIPSSPKTALDFVENISRVSGVRIER